MIAGAVVGGVAGVALLALAGFCWIRRRRTASSQSKPDPPRSIISAFEPTEEVQIVVPFTPPHHDSPGQSSPSGPSDSSRVSPARRADDMEDNLLPPEYREAWGNRHSASLDDIAAVTREAKTGSRTQDSVPA